MLLKHSEGKISIQYVGLKLKTVFNIAETKGFNLFLTLFLYFKYTNFLQVVQH